MKNQEQPSTRRANWRLPLGPGLIVAAAFVGPGTVTVAAKAGARFGFELLWVVLFSVLGVIVLQEMAARLGTLTGIGLGELLRRQFKTRPVMIPLAVLVIVAIGFGNAAYQTGNLTGAMLGLEELVHLPAPVVILALVATASVLMWFGSYQWLERVLVTAVAMMGLAFVVAAVVLLVRNPPPLEQLVPTIPEESIMTILALIGTTIVPYNLFLHAGASARRWSPIRPRDRAIRLARIDTVVGVAAGGLVTLAILAAGAMALPGVEISSASDISRALSDGQGPEGTGVHSASVLFAAGLAAAGLTSAITAPLAAAYAICGLLGWSTEFSGTGFRAIWIIVMATGTLLSLTLGTSPTETILIAQLANALVLPIIAAILIMVCNAKLLGRYANGKLSNALSVIVMAIVVILSIAKFL